MKRSTIDLFAQQIQHVLKGFLVSWGIHAVAKVLYCNDLVPGCQFEAHGDSEEEILAEAADHIAMAHGMTVIPDEIIAMVRAAIREEVLIRARAAGA